MKFKILCIGIAISYMVPFGIELVLGVKIYRFVDKNLMKTTERVQELHRQFTRNLVIQVCLKEIRLELINRLILGYPAIHPGSDNDVRSISSSGPV